MSLPAAKVASAELLRVSGLHAFYGESHILHGVDFAVGTGELVTLLGRNGSGRTTTLKSIVGLVDKRTGSIVVSGRETIAMPSHRIVRLGLGYCPEERGIFASLTAEENLTLLPVVGPGGMALDEITEGLAPVIVQALGRAVRALKERGYTIILVEQNFRFVAPLADRHFLVERGRIVDALERGDLEARMESLQRFLGV